MSSESSGYQVAVIGAGITGLAAAQRLIQLDPDVRVTLLDSSDHCGGVIRTEQQNGYLMELGPDSFITNKPGGVQLCEDVGFSDQLLPTDNTYRRSLVLRNGRPQPVPDGFMLMAPAKPLAIATTPVLSWSGKLRLLRELWVPQRTTDDDESLASFVRRRFGSEALDRLVQPLVGGIYTSDPEKLSLRATLPRFLDMERNYGSVIRATLAEQKRAASKNANNTAGSGARYGLFATPQDGLGSLVTAVEKTLRDSGRVTFCLATAVKSVAPTANDPLRWKIEHSKSRELGAGGEPSSTAVSNFHSVIITLPAYRVADVLVGSDFSNLTDTLRQIEYASSAIVLTGHRLADFRHPLDAFGLVIPHNEQREILAVSFTSRKFPGRAPDGCILLRTFVGGAMQPELMQRDDDKISEIVDRELRSLLGMKRPAEFCRVLRYERAMPQYYVGHLDRVDRIERLTAEHPGLHIAGNAYRGVGIPDSIASGRSAAESVVRDV